MKYFIIKEDSRYEISEDGKFIRCVDKKRIKSQYLSDQGYYMISIRRGKKSKPYRVHRIIANNFIPNPDNLPDVNHIDGDKTNNNIKNLEWVTHLQNMQHAFKTGLINNTGEKNGMAKLNRYEVKEIKEKLKEGYSQQKIANQYGVSRSAILKIHLGKTWVHVKV